MSSVMNAIPHEASHMPYGIPLLPQGLWLLHQKHGLTMWSELLDPAIKLANTGYMVDSVLASAIETNREKVQSSLGLSSLYFFANGTMKSRENKILNPQLGKVLLQIANQMSDALLPADLIQNFSSDIDSSQSPTFNQMLYKKYLNIESPVTIHLPGMTMLTPPAPSAGQILSDLIWEMNSQKPLENTSKDHSINRAYSVLLNASKMTYASHGFKPSNSSHQASTSWDPAPAGANVLIANSHGDIFVMSISLNSSFGSGFVSPSTGILMNDFIHGPESPSASTPIFWASPTVVIIAGTDNDIVGLVASGASSLPFALGQVILNHVYLMNDLTVSVSGPLVDLTSGSSDPWLEYLGIWGKKPDSERRPEDYSCSTVAVGVEAEHVHVAKSPGLCCYYRGI
ncbi:glutathione hydrolase 6 [Bombina bombina]|uniref:glutathione hydrolase 6 n=1 Tax=Bombina bombina TaxID=8345 RepID=UPI00235B218B|nr:glutathione hydrolase 6 [Bombina bombina]